MFEDRSTRPATRRVLSPQQRRQRNRDEMTEAILEAARAIMRAEGAAGLNLNELARRVGLTTPALYGYFPSKAGIYDALYQRGGRLVCESDEAVWATHPPGWSRLRAWFAARLSFAQAHPDLHQLIFGAAIPGYVPSEESRTLVQRQLDSVVRGLTEIFDTGEVAPGMPTERAIDLLLAMRHGIVAERIGKATVLVPGTARFDHVIDDAIAMLQAAWSPECNHRES